MTLIEVIAKILKYISDNNLEVFTCACIYDISVERDAIKVAFCDGNTENWVIPIED